MGQALDAAEALKQRVVTNIYKEDSEIEGIITTFAKEFAPRAVNRKVLGEIKRKLHRDILIQCEDSAIAPSEIEIV